ncbi:RNA polymerase 2 mediator complex component [Niveomyces insectorum RCEF 264]|uniref:Mediator of RNA polymerase II transcription subunit 17 n=1 Tax=Niveomyces insectorum RCEF 264 TaxID=1081102 RepID=A0A162J4G9_9HYPO|nr:RNA polymerase 2 mediator complex component [Niveomyces insectorum RCEF 264]
MAEGSETAANASGLFGPRDPVFRPWPVRDRTPTTIAEFVQRVKAQGGEFRQLTEAGLRAEIDEQQRKREAGEGEDDGDGDNDATAESLDASRGQHDKDDVDIAGGKPKDIEAMIAKRDEILMVLESALQSGLIAVDFVSLLLSKDRPTHAVQTLSPLLREKVGIGTLSAGRVANAAQAARALQTKNHGGGGGGGGSMSAAERQSLDETTRSNAQRLLDHKTECVGWQLLAMDRAAALLAAGRKRLRTEMRREERYWSEVVAVHDRGWGLSRMPGQRRVLRVKFGFSESATDLRAAGFAPLRRVKRGHVALDMAALGPPCALVVTLRRRPQGGSSAATTTTTTGRSVPPARLPATAALEDRIREARNTIYAKELWRELNREARQMVAHGVVFRDGALIFPVGGHTVGTITLEPLQLAATAAVADGADNEPPLDAILTELAETMTSSLHLFLAHGHRQHYRQRSVPTPPTDSTGAPPPTYFMLRPLLANQKYEKAIEHLAQFLADLCSILHGVGQTGARFMLYERPLASFLPPPPPPPPPPAGAASADGIKETAARTNQRQSASEGLCTGFLAPREFTFELTLGPDVRLSIRSRTTVAPLKTQYLVQLVKPSAAPAPAPHAPDSLSASENNHDINRLLSQLFPPADNYGTLRDVLDYVGDVVARVLTARARSFANAAEAQADTGVAWGTAVDGMALLRTNSPFRMLRFCVVPTNAVTKLDALVDELANELAGEQTSGDRNGSGGSGSARHAWFGGNDDNDDVIVGDNNEDDNDQVQSFQSDSNADSPLQQLVRPELRMYASWPLSHADAAIYRRWAWNADAEASPGASLHDLVEGCVRGDLMPATEPKAE